MCFNFLSVISLCNNVECPLIMDNIIFFGIYMEGKDFMNYTYQSIEENILRKLS
ncbi:hypothetical protein Lalb_Chr11g0067241 [Lupinus albus]|uniref:Uncharacterized protein n=1 Tax=Lupinus albus TaxID=3870 RepID=A0A6A4PRC4_LUPAL|nr:hypothetical protein Lalb_Chr11g0067241 [Lupinus albus]